MAAEWGLADREPNDLADEIQIAPFSEVGENGQVEALKIEAPTAASEFGKTFPLTATKRKIKSRGFDLAEVRAFVDANYKPEKFAALLEPHRGNIV